jgi:putative alpha-1,2-mannosidase
MQGGTLEFDMGLRPNKKWGTSAESIPPSFQMKN